jgi:hypothetical protein
VNPKSKKNIFNSRKNAKLYHTDYTKELLSRPTETINENDDDDGEEE